MAAVLVRRSVSNQQIMILKPGLYSCTEPMTTQRATVTAKKTTPKTLASYRETIMTNREMEILKELEFMNELEKNTNLRYRDMGYLFTTKNGVPIQTNSFNLALKAANERLETPIRKNLTSHIFRHTLVSRLAENNVPLKAIMDRVGHADSKTTVQIYTHITKKMKSNVADIMENY